MLDVSKSAAMSPPAVFSGVQGDVDAPLCCDAVPEDQPAILFVLKSTLILMETFEMYDAI
jgi:hypothetical protein